MEPLTSAKRTVTCLRSPSRAALEVRIFSARCLGVYVSGAGERTGAAVPAATASPHWRQKRAPPGNSAPQEPQATARWAPQPRQNLAWVGLSCWHRAHFMPGEPPMGGAGPASFVGTSEPTLAGDSPRVKDRRFGAGQEQRVHKIAGSQDWWMSTGPRVPPSELSFGPYH